MKRKRPATNKEHTRHMCDPRSGGAYVVDGRDNAWSRAPGPHAHGNSEAGCGWPEDGGVWTAKQSNNPRNNQHNPNTPTTGRR